jgi:hypothetical protein
MLVFFCLDTKEPKDQVQPRYAFLSREVLAAKAGSTTGGLVFAYEQTVLY